MDRNKLLEIYDNCEYVDLESENAVEMLRVCSNSIMKVLNIEGFVEGGAGGLIKDNNNLLEGFTDKVCCPDGFKNINGACERVCINCKYNDCTQGSGNIGKFFPSDTSNEKAKKEASMDDNIFNYIIINPDTGLDTN